MGMVKTAKALWAAKKARKQIMKIFKSRTTKNQYKSKVAIAAALGSLFILIRTVLPELLPWGVVQDVAIAGVLGNLLDPILSRILAFRQDPSKKKRKG